MSNSHGHERTADHQRTARLQGVRTITVSAPSRLHFGLFAFGAGAASGGAGADSGLRNFGGVGVMLAAPRLVLRVCQRSGWTARGPLSERMTEFAQRWLAFHRQRTYATPQAAAGLSRPLPADVGGLDCEVIVDAAPEPHVGLGSGTAAALALAAGLNAWFALPPQSPGLLALSVGRGRRSAVGTYGFCQGGLIAERGRLAGEDFSPLDCRLPLPAPWRFVLVRPQGACGLSGNREQSAFRGLPAVPPETTRKLIALAREHLFPAAAQQDFPQFAENLYEYGNVAGSCFAQQQGGPYHGPDLQRHVDLIRGLGYPGVGQSSWGPTLFVVTRSAAEAEALAAELARRDPDLPLAISPPDNRGAVVTEHLPAAQA